MSTSGTHSLVLRIAGTREYGISVGIVRKSTWPNTWRWLMNMRHWIKVVTWRK